MQILPLTFENYRLQVPPYAYGSAWLVARVPQLEWLPQPLPLCMWTATSPLLTFLMQEAGVLLVAERDRALLLRASGAVRRWNAIFGGVSAA